MQEEYTWAERWAHLLINGRERLAVAAPGRIELDENVLASQQDLVKGVGRHDLDGAAVVLGRLLALYEFLHLASLRACIFSALCKPPQKPARKAFERHTSSTDRSGTAKLPKLWVLHLPTSLSYSSYARRWWRVLRN